MRVIKAPDLATFKLEATCVDCTTVVELDYADLAWREPAAYGEFDQRESMGAAFWVCPTCRTQNVVGYSHLPDAVRSALKRAYKPPTPYREL